MRSVSKKGSRPILVTERDKGRAEMGGHPLHALGDFAQALRPVVNGVHRGHDGEQDLRGADVARRLVAADVLLAGLEREAHRGPALRVMGNADEPPRHVALEFVLRREKGRVGSTITERHAKPLRRTDGDVRAEFAGRLEQGQRQQIGGHGDLAADLVDQLD